MASQGLSRYLNGTTAKSIDLVAGKLAGWMVTTPDEVKAVAEYEKTLPTWVEKDTKV